MRVFIALLVIASVTAWPNVVVDVPAPQPDSVSVAEGRFVDGIVASALEELSVRLRDSGYDPYLLEEQKLRYELPVPQVGSAGVSLRGATVSGVSDFVINRINYAVLSSRLTFDISLPRIIVQLDEAEADAVLLNNRFNAAVNGKLSIENVGVRGRVDLRISLFGGISVRDLDVELYLNEIQSDLDKVAVLGKDFSKEINQFISVNVYHAFLESSDDINQLVNIIAWEVVNELL